MLYGFAMHENIMEYYKDNTEDELLRFVGEVVEKHKIEHGILIHRDIHAEFHNIYGTRYNTEKDFYNFLTTRGWSIGGYESKK